MTKREVASSLDARAPERGMPSRLRVVYAGSLWLGSTSLQRERAIESLGHDVTTVDSFPDSLRRRERWLPLRILFRVAGPLDLAGANRKLLEAARRHRPDVVWVDKGVTLSGRTLREVRRILPDCRIVGYSPDDMMNPRNQTRRFLKSLPAYDLYFTTKSYGVAELRELGCRRVEFVGNAFDPEVHRPVPVAPEERERLGGPVGFIGQWEAERGRSIVRLADAGFPVRVWGPSWEKLDRKPGSLALENRSVWHDDYARTLCAFDVNLCFLRKANRDLQTTRSIEIPACGAFMLAERTDEHLDLFREGREAEFFGSDDELIAKVRHYLERPEERRRIAEAGRRRCLESGYSYPDRMRRCLDIVRGIE